MKLRKIISFAALSLLIFNINTIKSFADSNKYETYKKTNQKQVKLSNDEYIPEEVKLDLLEEANMDYLKKKTSKKYEIAMADSNGDYTYVKAFNSLDDAINEVKNIKNKKSNTSEVPVIINEDGIVVYATQSIGRLTRLVDGKASTDRRFNVNIYSTSTSKNALTYANHGYMDDMPIIAQTATRVKVEVNGVIGWIDKQETQTVDGKKKTVTNVVQVPLNQANNLSYYKRSGNDLIHYISSNVAGGGGYSVVIGKAPSFMKDGSKYYSYDGNYFYDSIEKLLSDAENGNHNNAVNSKNTFYNYYLYLPGRTKTSYTAKDLNKYLSTSTSENSILRNKGAEFIQAQNKYGVNASFMIGIAMNESAKGTSSIATSKNNIFGLNAVDSSPGQSANYFNSVGDCVNEFASHWMSKGYFNTSDWRYNGSSLGNKGFGVNVRYASDPYWGEKACSYMYDMDKIISGSSLSEHNKYTLGMYTKSSSVKNSSGSEMYTSTINTIVPILSTSGSNYKINGERQVASKPTTGDYNWNSEMTVLSSSVKKINTSYDGALNQKQINAINKFEQFYIYGPYMNPTIDLSNSYALISKKSQATGILATVKDGKKTDRQKFLDAWNKLSSTEKSNSNMEKMYYEYNKIINIAESAEEIFTYFDYIKSNVNSIKLNRVKAIELYNENDMTSGRRGSCIQKYNEALKYGENESNSKRMDYINNKYNDSISFLKSVELLIGNKIDNANDEANKINDKTLRNTALENIKSYSSKYTYNQRAVLDRFERFYIYGSLSNPTIDLSNKDEVIKSYSQAVGILKTKESGKSYDRQKFLNAWNKLSSSEKNHKDMVKINNEYNKIISIATAARENFNFYNNIKNNAESIVKDYSLAKSLNKKSNTNSGARGSAYSTYTEAKTYGENGKNSARMKYLYDKYIDAVNFLDGVAYLKSKDYTNAKLEANKIKDKTLKNVLINRINYLS